jgi:hypothetical protein
MTFMCCRCFCVRYPCSCALGRHCWGNPAYEHRNGTMPQNLHSSASCDSRFAVEPAQPTRRSSGNGVQTKGLIIKFDSADAPNIISLAGGWRGESSGQTRPLRGSYTVNVCDDQIPHRSRLNLNDPDGPTCTTTTTTTGLHQVAVILLVDTYIHSNRTAAAKQVS